MNKDNEPTVLTREDIDKFMEMWERGDFDPKQMECFTCGQIYFGGYGAHMEECDECFFQRIPKETKEAFFKSFLD